jgi:hypothetical protein
MSKFIILSDQLTTESQNAITSHLQNKGWKVWHWYEAAWLISGVPDGWTSRTLHDELDGIPSVRGARLLVIEAAEPQRYWGRSPKPSWKWMKEEWGPPG